MGFMIRALGFFLLFWHTVVSDFKVICVSVFMASAQIPAIKLQRTVLLVDYIIPGVPLTWLGEATWLAEVVHEASWVAVHIFANR